MKTKSFAIIILLILVTISVQAQSGKRYQGRKKTNKREIKKQQLEAQEKQAEETPFAPARTSIKNLKNRRDDFIWKSQTAGIIDAKTANISIIEPSKYAFSKRFQVESILPLAYHTPNIFAKYQWHSYNNWLFSSRHGFYSATTGLRFLQSNHYDQYIDANANIPLILSTKNEIIVSRWFSKVYGCNGRQPYLILTGSAGFDFGLPLGDSQQLLQQHHFLTNRAEALTGNGWLANIMLRADYQLSPSFLTGASLKYFQGSFDGNRALENKLWIEGFLGTRFSISGGLALSYANYSTKKALALMPTVDLCWYLGSKAGLDKGLFKKKMF